MNKPQAASAFSPDCVVVRAGEPFVGKQGFTYAAAISAESVGARALHMQILTMPPGAKAKAHKHEAHETAIYVLSGEAGTYYGERLETHFVSRAGDFVDIPPTCRTFPTTSARPSPASPSSRAPIPTSRRASSCCRVSTRSTAEPGGASPRRASEPGGERAGGEKRDGAPDGGPTIPAGALARSEGRRAHKA